ncbi:MAG TPA: hypothetical protein DG048_11190 [Pseudoalteromonas sp.]|nr:hypothetical protein [Pseudoalteromonas sp.]
MLFYTRCPLSHNADKQCQFAYSDKNEIKCSYIIGYYHKRNIKNLQSCFAKMLPRQKLQWRNKMIRKFGQPKI